METMTKKYVIQWKSKVNGRAGRGTKLFDKSEAEQLVEELNREYPQIVHEIVEVQTTSEEQSKESAPEPTPFLSIV